MGASKSVKRAKGYIEQSKIKLFTGESAQNTPLISRLSSACLVLSRSRRPEGSLSRKIVGAALATDKISIQ